MRVRVPLLAVSAAAWLLLVARPHETMVCMMPSMRWTPASLLAASALMFASMMVPLIGAPVLHVRDRSFANRRWRAIALFIAGYGLPWIAASVVLLLASSWIVAAESPLLMVLTIVAIALWQCSPIKQRCLNRGHAHTELAAFGVKADLDALRFGLVHAWWCIGSCFALMLLPMLFTRGHLAVMAGVTLWLAGERLERTAAPRWRWRGPSYVVRIIVGQARVWGRLRPVPYY
jgi:predicted metal-binding membrane protein